MSAALLQGARGSTEDIDLWFEDVTDPRIADCVRAAGGIWISGAFGRLGELSSRGADYSRRMIVVVSLATTSTSTFTIVPSGLRRPMVW